MEKKDIFLKAFVARIDGNTVQDKQQLMKTLAAAFRFPAYFGENWDALADCLRSLPEEMEEYSCFILEIGNFATFLSESPAVRKDFEEVFMDAADFVAQAYGKRLFAVML